MPSIKKDRSETVTKTTINLPSALLSEARSVAREEGITLKEIFLAGLRSELDRRREGETTVEYVPVTFGGEGLHPDVEGLDMEQIVHRIYRVHDARRSGEAPTE